MPRRQTSPARWLLITGRDREQAAAIARTLPRGSGIVLLGDVPPRELRRLRQASRARRLVVLSEQRLEACRVHNVRELRAAMAARTPLIMLSPMFATATHPDWTPLPRMRAATLARLGKRGLVALGGMNERRYATIAQLGFSGWAGISAFRT